MRRTSLALSVLLVLGMLSSVPASATEGGVGLTPLDTIAFDEFPGGEGTDSDFIEMDITPGDGSAELSQVGVFGSINGGARILDVSAGVPVELGFYECKIGQGDIQLFQRGEGADTRTYFTFTDDGYSGRGGVCQEFNGGQGKNKQGTFIVDITNPGEPTTVSFVPFAKGSHNMTVHPSTNYLYNSNSELITNAANAGIEIFDITDLTKPVPLQTLRLPARPGLGTDSHDITFNADGSRAYSAALSQGVIINTEDPAKPVIVTSFLDPAINVWHQANPVTIDDPILGERDFLIVEDEFGGAAGADQTCPSGGTHVYDITDERELNPVKVGAWYVDDVANTNAAGLRSCTAHVFDIHEDAAIMTMSFYGGGVRVIDISGLVGLSLGGNGLGMREIGYHRFNDSNSWSFKAAELDVAEDGTISGFMYSNDIDRGIDTYEFEGNRADATGLGRWFEGTTSLDVLGAAELPADYKMYCLLKGSGPAEAVTSTVVSGL